jgi:hypothetical protein
MERHLDKLKELQEQLKLVVKDVEKGKINKAEAADRIIEIRQHMDDLLAEMKKVSQPQN